jgi:iron complex transport system substrate-binding protein
MRVASLLPSATEIVCAVGARDELVGVSHECDYPEGVCELPRLTSTRLSPSAASDAIDRDVRALLRSAAAVYDLDTERLAALAPDVIVTQDLCDVCAVSLRDVEAAARTLFGPRCRVVSLHPLRLGDIWQDIARVGAALGRETEASRVIEDGIGRVRDIGARAERAPSRPRVLTLEWIEPPMAGGTWMPELVELAGGTPLVTQPGERAPTLSREMLRALDPAPDVVLVKPCGFDLERTQRELEALRALLAPLAWPAVRERRVWIADGNAFFNRPGPRIVESLEILAACVHPELFPDFAARHARSFELLRF